MRYTLGVNPALSGAFSLCSVAGSGRSDQWLIYLSKSGRRERFWQLSSSIAALLHGHQRAILLSFAGNPSVSFKTASIWFAVM